MEVQTTELGRKVLGAAIEVHSDLGPGLLESIYERCMAEELKACGICFEEQVAVPIRYRSAVLDCAYRVDFVVNGELLLELKAVERTLPIHDAQILTYLKLMKLRQGFLLNFNVRRMKDGIKSFLL